ncbi:hypothetical protein BST61_g4199 [Cercospora zeina]
MPPVRNFAETDPESLGTEKASYVCPALIHQRLLENQQQMSSWPYSAEMQSQDAIQLPGLGQRSAGDYDASMSTTLEGLGFNLAADTALPIEQTLASPTSQLYESGRLPRPPSMHWSPRGPQTNRNSTRASESNATNVRDPKLLYEPSSTNRTPHNYDTTSCNSATPPLTGGADQQNHTTDIFHSRPSQRLDVGLSQDNTSRRRSAQSSAYGASIEHAQQFSCPNTPLTNDGTSYNTRSSTGSPKSADTQIERAIEAIRCLGFDSIDHLAAQYYTADLQSRPGLRHRQRLSRRRGLPDLLGFVREDATANWTDWETQPYRDEIMRAAEEVLNHEIARFIELYGSMDKHSEDLAAQKRLFQEELPNLLSLLGTLAMSSKPEGGGDRADSSLHAIYVLLCGSNESP